MSDDVSVVFDTETTGLDPSEGDRVIEIACIEIRDLMPTGREFYALIDPCRSIPPDATRIHGRTDADVQGMPTFNMIAPRLIEFLGDKPLIAHNAPFDMGFINAELDIAGFPPLTNMVIDTVAIARSQFQGSNTLDTLCRRFGIDLSKRTKHDALLDTRLLSKVYLHLMGGPHRNLDLQSKDRKSAAEGAPMPTTIWPVRNLGGASAEELALHEGFVERLKNPLWQGGR